MADPLTTEDLYGKSPPVAEQKLPEKPLEYEETPIIDPIQTSPESTPHTDSGDSHSETPKLSPPHDLPRMRPPSSNASSRSHTGTNILAFILLFIAGIWLSSFLRQFLPSDIGNSLGLSPKKTVATPTPTVLALPTISVSNTQWKSYDVISGVTKKPVGGISYMLPPDVLPPICDGSGCASQGTYLPGGTRFTVAARGTGQSLRDYRGTAISDINGVTFTTKDTLVAGKQAKEFTGTFTGRTISGYAFTTMRGVMIPLSDTTSVEFNHFIPSGITADFQKDDVLFETILTKIVVGLTDQSQKGAVLAPLSPTPSSVSSQAAILTATRTPTPTPLAR